MNLASVVAELRKEERERTAKVGCLDSAIAALNGAKYGNRTGKRRLSAAARERISAAQRARWKKFKAAK